MLNNIRNVLVLAKANHIRPLMPHLKNFDISSTTVSATFDALGLLDVLAYKQVFRALWVV